MEVVTVDEQVKIAERCLSDVARGLRIKNPQELLGVIWEATEMARRKWNGSGSLRDKMRSFAVKKIRWEVKRPSDTQRRNMSVGSISSVKGSDRTTYGEAAIDSKAVEAEDVASKDEYWEIVRSAVSPPMFEVLLMRYRDDLTQQEIGDSIGITQEAAGRRLRKAVAKLQKPRLAGKIKSAMPTPRMNHGPAVSCSARDAAQLIRRLERSERLLPAIVAAA